MMIYLFTTTLLTQLDSLEDYLNLLDTLEPFFIEDDKRALIYTLKTSREGNFSDKVEAIDYDDLEANVWKDQMIDRYYKECEFDGCYYQNLYATFVTRTMAVLLQWNLLLGFLCTDTRTYLIVQQLY